MEEQTAALEAENTTLKAQLKQSLEVIGDLKAKLEASESAPKSNFVTAKVGKDEYEILIPSFFVKGQLFTAQELAKDKEAMKYLIDVESEAIRKK